MAHVKGSGAVAEGARYHVIVAVVAALVFVGCMVSPPSLMDDVDAVQAQIARNMLQSGDWVTARLDGVAYLEKSPLKYWMIAVCFATFGPHDWAARIPVALSAVLLCWVTARFAAWAFGASVGLRSGIVMATSIGLFLFTRILIPDVLLTLTITLALWGLLRVLDEEEKHPGAWAMGMWAAIGTGLLLKGLIAAAFPLAAALIYLGNTRQLLARRTWARIRPFWGGLVALAIAAPWHVLATIGNPPYFDFTMHSEKGSYHGFFWFYFINEHLLRFLNLRYPRDYNTVPRWLFWGFHLLWFFPWSLYFPAAFRLKYRGGDRAARTRLLCLCWAGFILLFFTFSTTQEYYSMPCYPALAMLLACAMASGSAWLKAATKIAAAAVTLAFAAVCAILWMVRGMASPGDISSALSSNPDVYTLSLGHMLDLTLESFAYLKLPLAVAGAAFATGAIAGWRSRLPVAGFAAMLVLFFHAARLALVVFDPYLSSRPLAEALLKSPPGGLIVDDQYYTFSSVFFYTNRRALLLNGRVNNLDYGSYAPDAPKDVFIDDAQFRDLWMGPKRFYLTVEGPKVDRLQRLTGAERFHVRLSSGGKFLFTNQ
ncbi:MAG TPA: glycosyltransferase family 39 protein [Candidatus Acidoferrales bacterium]|nr:glycosyltransferase family 39 protein [Candidatus Acidoferrales bacterium]